MFVCFFLGGGVHITQIFSLLIFPSSSFLSFVLFVCLLGCVCVCVFVCLFLFVLVWLFLFCNGLLIVSTDHQSQNLNDLSLMVKSWKYVVNLPYLSVCRLA